MTASKKILVVASTFPAHDSDPVPAFVKDQIVAMKRVNPLLSFAVLAPHDFRSHTKSFIAHTEFDEYRFHYAFPRSLEKLAGRGIMPALEANPLNYLLILPLFIGEFFALYRLTKRLRPDTLYAHWFTPQAVICTFVSMLTHTPYIFTTHASDVKVWHKIPFFGKHIVTFCASRAGKITAVSRRSMEKLQTFFSEEDWSRLAQKTTIIPMGVDIRPVEEKVSTNTKTILFVGRLAEKKGVQYLLPAFKKVVEKRPNTKLIVAGDGPWLDKLTRMASSLGLDDYVDFPGYVTGDDKQALLQKATFYVVPSIVTASGDAEGLPVSLMEGMSNGKVCIATNESGADDIITNEKDGFLVPEKDVDALVNAIDRALSLNQTKRQAVMQSAIETSEQFSWPMIAKKHISFFEFR